MDAPSTPAILTVTWDTVIGARHVASGDYDEPPAYEPVSLGEAVTEALAAQLASRIDAERDQILRDARRDLHEQVARIRTEVIREQVTELVREQMAKPLRKTNSWGEPIGKETTTLTDLIATEVKTYLSETAPRRGYSEREREGGLMQLLRTAVADAMQKELKAEIDRAKERVRSEVAGKAAELFGDVVKAATR